ncbi:MAG: hypothetical protein IT429_25700 [Gemmataceae bacterium]|nr:hypothetical protein [Gemmataceae bacterium]
MSEQVVVGEVRRQCGYEYLRGRCPRCRFQICVDGEGRIQCNCGTLLRFVKPIAEVHGV